MIILFMTFLFHFVVLNISLPHVGLALLEFLYTLSGNRIMIVWEKSSCGAFIFG
jgi:hypothetical protein